MLTKLTLSAEKDIVASAKKLAHKNKTSISSMFSRFMQATVDIGAKHKIPLAPITIRASGIVNLPKGKTDTELLGEALSDKYGIGK